MPHAFADIAFTPAVRALQARAGSRDAYARMQAHADEDGALGPREATFLGAADSLYLASTGADGWPYVQHRGGPRGFLRVVSPRRIAFADFRGNQQFVSAGNVAGNDRIAMIVVDYANRERLKLLGRLRFVELDAADAALVAAVALPGYRARVERIAVIEVAGFDWNCPQHIPQRFSAEYLAAEMGPLQARIVALEARLAGTPDR